MVSYRQVQTAETALEMELKRLEDKVLNTNHILIDNVENVNSIKGRIKSLEVQIKSGIQAAVSSLLYSAY
jgi:peptidoglycan hydrolase CwlO-like protein